jgi:multicomponent Na+:H+ antiporter subunit B
MILAVDILLLGVAILLAVKAIHTKDLVESTVLFAGYSFVLAVIWFELNSVDVSFTEAAVGAGVSTILLVAVIALSLRYEEEEERSMVRNYLAAIACITFFIVLALGVQDLPIIGDPNAPHHQHVVPRYIENTYEETGVVNIVTAILANYRGYDTLGEVTVIFTAGISVILLLRRVWQ